MITKRFIFNTIFIWVLLFIIVCMYLIMFGYIKEEFFLPIEISFVVVLYEFFKYNNVSQPIFLKVLLVYIPITIISSYVSREYSDYELNKYGCTTWYAVVYNKRSSYNSSNNISFSYTKNGISIDCGVQLSSKKTYDKLNIGDTILIIVSNYTVSNYKVINYFPTHEEIQEFKKGKPYEPKKQKNK